MRAPVSMGDIIRTKSNARAEITFLDGTILRLAQKTRIGVTDSNTLDLMRGRVRTIFAQATQDIKLRTPYGQAVANGRDFYFLHEKGSSWFYGAEGTIQASSMNAPADITFVENRDCCKVTPGLPIQDSCVFKDIDVQKFAWDTSTVESTPVVAVLPAEGEVFTYKLLDGRAIDTPSLAVPIQNQDLVCTQCPPEVLRETVPGILESVKLGNWERLDRNRTVPAPPGPPALVQ